MKFSNKVLLGSTAVVASSSAFATDANAIGSAITAAVASGQANYSLVVIGIIGLAAIGFGVGMIVSSMRK
ncbi:hypothetical protein [Aliivibrio sp. EL58]|uniref:hypothetical protein n=1 Tax=Aliivibrio sp. EL58 TaxID=2107582 RepID=UPI000EFAB479|nr:hypothetical protein [Aliivibrio sp. EL58]